MGIEPTWDFVEPHTGFEDQERHQVAPHLHPASARRLILTGMNYFRRAALRKHWDTFERQVQCKIIANGAPGRRDYFGSFLISASSASKAKPSATTR